MVSLRLLVVAVTAIVLVSGGPAWAGAPTDQLRSRVDRVIRVLEDPELKQEAQVAKRRAEIRSIALEIFDFPELSRRALAQHWQARTATERAEFIALFTDLLERSYLGKIETYSGGEKVQYLSESLEGGLATVRTRIVSKAGTEVPVEYRMHRVDERWLVYDVAIEGVSLVANYRAQFNKLIQTSSFPGLMEKLKAKRDEALEADTSGKRASQK
jgi:phospholipid transport system substrate-binding protein